MGRSADFALAGCRSQSRYCPRDQRLTLTWTAVRLRGDSVICPQEGRSNRIRRHVRRRIWWGSLGYAAATVERRSIPVPSEIRQFRYRPGAFSCICGYIRSSRSRAVRRKCPTRRAGRSGGRASAPRPPARALLLGCEAAPNRRPTACRAVLPKRQPAELMIRRQPPPEGRRADPSGAGRHRGGRACQRRARGDTWCG